MKRKMVLNVMYLFFSYTYNLKMPSTKSLSRALFIIYEALANGTRYVIIEGGPLMVVSSEFSLLVY
ncbi:MAG: hypothetical protein ACJATI_002218 [Halioglobus sp.]|jgi:hypothetical protein